MVTESDGEVGAKCNIMSTEGEKERLLRHKENDNSIITYAFFIIRGRTQLHQWVQSVGLNFVFARTN